MKNHKQVLIGNVRFGFIFFLLAAPFSLASLSQSLTVKGKVMVWDSKFVQLMRSSGSVVKIPRRAVPAEVILEENRTVTAFLTSRKDLIVIKRHPKNANVSLGK